MKRPIFLLMTVIFLWRSNHLSAQEQLTAVVPNVVPEGVFLGMPHEDFKRAVDLGKMTVDTSRVFRWTYFHENPDEAIEGILYYIDHQRQHQPLYQIVVAYGHQEKAYDQAVRLFGKTNYLNKKSGEVEEWRFSIPGMPAIWVWCYQGNLVVIGKIPGTEWAEEWDLY